jgi:hypothetical protein
MTDIDQKIETHLAALVAEAYPDLEEDQVLYIFGQGRFDFARSNRRGSSGGHVTGTDNIVVTVQIHHAEKLNRYALIARAYRKRVDLGDGDKPLRELAEWRFRDYVEATHLKVHEFIFNFNYEVSHAVS